MADVSKIRTDWREHPEVVVNEAIAAAMSMTDPSQSIDALLSYVGQSMGADRAYIFELYGEDAMRNTYEWCAEGVSPQMGNLSDTSLDIYRPVWLPHFLAHEAVTIPDVEAYASTDPVVADVLRPQGISALVAIPLFLEGAFVGFIGIDNPAQGVGDGMAAFLETLASFTSALLRHRNNVKRLFKLSSHDRVSGAFDTLYLLQQVQRARKGEALDPESGLTARDLGDPSRVAVVYCNLVQFKEFNAIYGMAAGNRCLEDVAKALGEAFGSRFVSRYSADHFIVFYGKDDLWERIDDAHRLVLGLRSDFKLWLSAGVCVADGGKKLSEAVDLAKVACDRIPKDGQSYTCLYTGKIEEELERKKYLQDHIEQAIAEGWVQVYYQPVVRSLTGRLAGVEALSRWNDPVYGSVSPGVFVPALEEKHLSYKLLACVIERVCSDLAERYHKGLPVVPVSVNVSRTDFESCEPFDVIDSAVRAYGLPESLICVEITESVAMGDPKGIEAVVQRFTHAGYEVWMDDFGSAYSSLNTLKDFSFGKLKLDMLFMHNFNQRSKDIISSIIGMAKKLGVHTLAEGVETKEQMDFLIDAGCEEIQGFYFSKPLPLSELDHFSARIVPESHAERDLYNELGLVRVHIAVAGGLVFYKDDTARALYASSRLRQQLALAGMNSPQRLDELLNGMDGRFAQTFHDLASHAIASRETETVPFAFRGRGLRLAVRVVAQSPAGTILLVGLQNVVTPSVAIEEDEPAGGDDGAGYSPWAPALLRGTAYDEGSRAGAAPSQQIARQAGGPPAPASGDGALLELKRGFDVPSLDLASTSMEIRHSKGDALETFTALSSIFITLVNVDLVTWKVQPIKIAKVTESYLSGEYEDYDTVVDKFIQFSVDDSWKEALERFTNRDDLVQRLSKHGTIVVDYKGANLGWCRLFLISISTNDEGEATKALFAVRDINAEKATEQRMTYEITHDPLTKAFNRNGLRQAVGLVRGYKGAVAYVICDVDRFKEYNDTYGHEKGDELLTSVARLLIGSFDATDYVARIGGDEFVILLTHYHRDDDGSDIRERIAKVNRELATTPGTGMSLSAGIVVSREGYRDDLYTLADGQLYEEKAAGKGGSRVAVV